jgi:hypothetical protein
MLAMERAMGTTRARALDPVAGPLNPTSKRDGAARNGIFGFLFGALPVWAAWGDSDFMPAVNPTDEGFTCSL